MDIAQCIGPSRWSHEDNTYYIDTSTLLSNTAQRRNRGEDDFEFENELVENDEIESNFEIRRRRTILLLHMLLLVMNIF